MTIDKQMPLKEGVELYLVSALIPWLGLLDLSEGILTFKRISFSSAVSAIGFGISFGGVGASNRLKSNDVDVVVVVIDTGSPVPSTGRCSNF